jgi:uncharacterized protein (DUF302 family)
MSPNDSPDRGTRKPPEVTGMIALPSPHGAAETVQRLESLLKQKGIRLFTRIDHAGGAGKVGLPLRFTQVLLFGNPQVGTALMQSNQTVGIDLPLRALIWEDEAGKVWLGYDDPHYLAGRHHIVDRDETVRAMSAGLQALAQAATAP